MKDFALLAVCAAALYAQAPAAPQDVVIATVDGMPITAGELNQYIQASPQIAQQFRTSPSAVIQNIYTLKYLDALGEMHGLAQQSPIKQILELQRAQTLAQEEISREQNTFPVGPEDMDAYYHQHQELYQKAHIKIILITFKATVTGTSTEDLKAAAQQLFSKSQRSEADAKALAEDLVMKIRGGADFAKLVAEYSDDPASKAAAGDFGIVTISSSLPEDLKKAVFALKAGEVAEPVRQPAGYYVIQCQEKSLQPIDDARPAIVTAIRRAHFEEYMNGLAKRFTPKIEKPEILQEMGISLSTPAAPAPPKP